VVFEHAAKDIGAVSTVRTARMARFCIPAFLHLSD
jgi:hypothetical protein